MSERIAVRLTESDGIEADAVALIRKPEPPNAASGEESAYGR